MNVQVEILGAPSLGWWDLGKLIRLKVWHPAYIDDDGDFYNLRWTRNTKLANGQGSALNQKWSRMPYMIIGFTHTIQEGAFTTALELVPIQEDINKGTKRKLIP